MKTGNMLIRCEPEDKALVGWAADALQLDQSEVLRQGLRIGIPILVKRLKRMTPYAKEASMLRSEFKQPVTMAGILKATEAAHWSLPILT